MSTTYTDRQMTSALRALGVDDEVRHGLVKIAAAGVTAEDLDRLAERACAGPLGEQHQAQGVIAAHWPTIATWASGGTVHTDRLGAELRDVLATLCTD